MVEAAINIFKLPDLRRRLAFTAFILVIFRLVAHIPVPGVDRVALQAAFMDNQLLGLLDLFSGGAMSLFSVAAMGVYPYITASIIMQLLLPLIPRLQALSKEGEAGRNKINQYTHWLTIPLAALQAFSQVSIMQSQYQVVKNFGLFNAETWLPSLAMVVTLTAGTVFCVWLGELITESGIGNGVSIIILGGIVARLPQGLGRTFLAGTDLASNLWSIIVFLIIELLTIALIVVMEQGQRRIPVQYAKRIRGTRMYGGQSTHIPLRVNSAGMIPLIFANSFLIFPGIIASYFQISTNPLIKSVATAVYKTFYEGSTIYWVLYFLMVIGFTYFYATVTFQEQNLPDNLQKFGGFVPGIRPGKPTSEYLNKVLSRITLAGALYLGVVAVLPYFAQMFTGIQMMALSSTALLILVGVVLDTIRQLEAQLLMRHYEGFIKT
ncbi:MAG: preprotein translocase subunit SecY [Chloroflexi bacterium]|nr:preprotein translocase subunit SecY [Chloroflexota bacterium]